MRFYLKLFVLVAIFACASRWPLPGIVCDLAWDVRVAAICAFGSAADREALIEETQRRLACERGNLDQYLKGQLYKRLVAERLAAAARRNIRLSKDDLDRIWVECIAEAFGTTVCAAGEDDAAAVPVEAISVR
ncbi:MAG: hypothetical protein KY475_27770 [Planctomycetes bacterium]|nr:hypothetical protein [Planctomycetota bacterium]